MTTTKNLPGLYWHVHHRQLVEYCWDYEERRDYIEKEKSKKERAIRLRLFRPVRGHLPPAYDKARDAYDKARDAYDKARDAYFKANAVYDKASAVYDKASAVYAKASDAYDKARDAYDKARDAAEPHLLALHKQECGCAWTPEAGIDFRAIKP